MDDPDLIRFIKYRGEQDERSWGDWLAAKPVNEQAFREAERALTVMLSVVPVRPETGVKESDWVLISARMDREERRGRVLRWSVRAVIGAAASVLVVLTGYWYYNSSVTVQTGNAEIKKLELPDRSMVTLNANSSLMYRRAWWLRGTREVWLKGEGLFDVTHVSEGVKFTAHADRVVVQDLGTTFNIKQRRDVVTVTLISGKISVRDERQKRPSMVLHPGEVINFEDSVARVETVDKMTNQPQAWVDRKIEANGMSVQDIIDNFKDTYGVQIVLSDPKKASMRIDGTMSLATQEGTLYTLANILNADIQREGGVIYLHLKK